MRRLTYDLLVWFSTHPDEALMVMDIADKFSARSTKPVYESAHMLVRDGYLRLERLPTVKGKKGPSQNLYHPGPRLLDTLLK